VWVIFLMADALSAHRPAVVIGAAFTTITLIAGAAVVHRVLSVTDIATAAGWPALVITAALAWVLAAPYGAGGLAIACAILLALAGVYHRVIGTGHWAYIAAAVVFAFGGPAFLSRALGQRIEVVAVVATATAALGCLRRQRRRKTAVPTTRSRHRTRPVPELRCRPPSRFGPGCARRS
jgi:hypothetical protein